MIGQAPSGGVLRHSVVSLFAANSFSFAALGLLERDVQCALALGRQGA